MRRRHSTIAIAGSIHFVTTVTRIRGHWFVDYELCAMFLQVFEHSRKKHGVDCVGYVLMPDHFHALLHQPKEGLCIPQCIALFKKVTSSRWHFPEFHGVRLWKVAYDDVPVAGQAAIETKLNYLHNNPVRAGLVSLPQEYPFSSAQFYYDGGGSKIITVKRYSHW